MSSHSGGGSRRASAGVPKTPEEQHVEKVARAEENVRTAQARADEAQRAYRDALERRAAAGGNAADMRTLSLHPRINEINRAQTALRSAQTRLANLKAQGPGSSAKASTGGNRTASRTADKRAASYESRIAHHEAEAARLRAEYEEYKRTGNAPAKASGTRGSNRPQLVPVGHVNPALLGPDRPLDPYVLQQLYGNSQLRQALEGRALTALQQAAGITRERNPGTSPRSRSQKKALVDYIVSRVAGEGY